MQIAARLNRISASVSSMGRQRARELKEAGRDVVSLTTGEPDFDTPEHVLEAGDSMYFDSSMPHAYRRSGGRTCSAIVVTSA